MRSIDLNADMGESFGAWTMGRDAELMDLVSSINVACGFHAGDPTVLRRTVETAFGKAVKIGAHPSFPDLLGFGRREMKLSPAEVSDIVLYQVAAVKGVCSAYGVRLNHVKPHGALYNQAARDPQVARAIAGAVKKIDPGLVLFGLSGSHLISEGESLGLKTASEVFADRTYQRDGSLSPRSDPNAIVTDPEAAVAQVLKMIRESMVTSVDGIEVPIRAETVCIHGDGRNALEFAVQIRTALEAGGIVIG